VKVLIFKERVKLEWLLLFDVIEALREGN